MDSNDLTAKLKYIACELRQLDGLLKTETISEHAPLNEFRHELDRVRLTAWSVSEMINVKQSKVSSDALLNFLTSDRLRRLEEMVSILCADIDRRAIGLKTSGMQSLYESMNTLQERLQARAKEYREKRYTREHEYEMVNSGTD